MSTPLPKRQKRSAPTALDLKRDNARLRERLARLAALTDHYYGAYREARELLARREGELAELRRRLDLKPITLR